MPLNTDSLKRMHRNCLAAGLPITVTFATKDYTGSKTMVSMERLILDPGKLDRYRFSVQLSQLDFETDTAPTVDNVVTIAGTTYRVLGTTTDAADVALILHLGPEYA